jgi:ribosomal protein S19
MESTKFLFYKNKPLASASQNVIPSTFYGRASISETPLGELSERSHFPAATAAAAAAGTYLGVASPLASPNLLSLNSVYRKNPYLKRSYKGFLQLARSNIISPFLVDHKLKTNINKATRQKLSFIKIRDETIFHKIGEFIPTRTRFNFADKRKKKKR